MKSILTALLVCAVVFSKANTDNRFYHPLKTISLLKNSATHSSCINPFTSCILNWNVFTPVTFAADLGNLSVTAANADASCGQQNGNVTLSVIGCTSPYTYSWSNGSTTQNLSNLSPGMYTVTVSSSDGCTVSQSVVVGNAGSPAIVLTPTNLTCGINNGAVNSSVTGGILPYYYDWSNGFNTTNISNLYAGMYTLTICDANGCSGVQIVTITATPSPSISFVTQNSSCGLSNGSIVATVTSGTAPFSYLWSSGFTNATLTGVNLGSYSLTVTDATGCTTSSSTLLGSDISPSLLLQSTSASCGNANGSIISSPFGTAPFAYNWSNGATEQNITNVVPDNYTVTLTDANGCSMVASDNVSNIDAPVATISVTGSCGTLSNGVVSVTVEGGLPPYSFQWSNGETTQNLTGIVSGDYSLTITDANGCTIGVDATVPNSNGPQLNANATNTACGAATGSITLSVSGGTLPYLFSWSNGETTQNILNLASGDYTLTVTDANGCSSTIIKTVGESSGPVVVASVNSDSFCGSNGEIGAVVSGGTPPYIYLWNNGETASVLNAPGGTYDVQVYDFYGCSSSAQTLIVSYPSPIVSGVGSSSLCGNNGGSVDLSITSASGVMDINWNTGDTLEDLNDLAAGFYSVTVVDYNFCGSTFTIDVVDSTTNLDSIFVTVNHASCNGGDGFIGVQAYGAEPLEYLWSNGVSGASNFNLSGGTYILTVTDVYECNFPYSYVVNQPTGNATADISGPQMVGVNSTHVYTLPLQPTNSIVWDAPNAQITGQGTNTFSITWTDTGIHLITVTVTDPNGCVAYDTLSITVGDNVSVSEVKGAGIDLSIYPNPCDDLLIMSIESRNVGDCKAHVFSLDGKLLVTDTFVLYRGVTKHEFDVANFDAGSYLVKIITSDKATTHTFTILR